MGGAMRAVLFTMLKLHLTTLAVGLGTPMNNIE